MRKATAVIIAYMLCLLMAVSAAARNTSEAEEAIDFGRPCSLTMSYQMDGAGYQNVDVRVWRVGELTPEFAYYLSGEFANYPINLARLDSPFEWDMAANTLYSAAVSGQIPPMTMKTDIFGNARFTNLTPGLYLFAPVNMDKVSFSVGMVMLPNLNQDGSWSYDVVVHPKPFTDHGSHNTPEESDEEESEKVKYSVTKVWKDKGNEDKRPVIVAVDIFRNGILNRSVTLDDSNSWTYSWEAEKDGAMWTVMEINMPKGYTMAFSHNNDAFIIENVYDSETPEKPETPVEENNPLTGDSSGITLYAGMFILSLFGLVLLAISLKKDKSA